MSKNYDIFQKSGPASAKLTLLSGNSTQKTLKQEVATRWNSSFFMLQSLLDLQQPVNDALVLLKPELKLEDVDWVVISEILSVLAPFEEITRDLSSQYYPSVSKAIAAARELQIELDKLQCSSFDAMLHKDGLRDNIRRRFANIETSTPLLITTYLDPR